MHIRYASCACMLMLLLPVSLPAQTHSASVRGTVRAKSTKAPLPFVNVIVQNAADSTVVTGGTSDERGGFEVPNIPAGDYLVCFRLIGYEEKVARGVKITGGEGAVDLGTVFLGENAVNGDEVLVTAQKTLLAYALDKKTYNVDQDVMSKAGSASELLRNIPSIQVDIEGEVTLRGSSNVLILINGKPSPLMGKARAEVLEQMPANAIEKVEVITNPSAKYKPDGASGIINIVLRKTADPGVNGTATGNIGNDSRYNGSVRLSFAPGDLTVSGGYSVRRDSRNRVNTDDRWQTNEAATLSRYNETVSSSARPLSHMIDLSVGYGLDEHDSFGASGNYFYNSFDRGGVSSTVIGDPLGNTIQSFGRDRVESQSEKESGYSAFYEHAFPGDNHKLHVEFTGSREPEVEDNRYMDVFRLPASSPQFNNSIIRQDQSKKQLSLDYSGPVSPHATFEGGYAGEFNRDDQDYYFEFLDPLQGQFVHDVGKINHFLYDESIHAAYATYKQSLNAFSLLGGMRAEKAYTTSHLVTTSSVIEGDYFTLYPTLHLSYKFNEVSELQLSYSKRTRRPESEDLNPFPEYQDPRNVRVGNPNLLPEYTHSIELGCKWQNRQVSIVPSIYYQYTYNSFTALTQVLNDSTLLTTSANLSHDRAAGVECLVSGSAGTLLTGTLSANVFSSTIDASNLGYSARKTILAGIGSATVNVNLGAATLLQVNSNYSSSRLTPQGEYRPRFVANLGMRQELFDGKCAMVMTLTDLFNTLRRTREVNIPSMQQTVMNKRDGRIFYVGFTYHFGRPPKKSKEDAIRYDEGL